MKSSTNTEPHVSGRKNFHFSWQEILVWEANINSQSNVKDFLSILSKN